MPCAREVKNEVRRLHSIFSLSRERPGNHRFQLTHVAKPEVVAQSLYGGGGKRNLTQPQCPRKIPGEPAGQRRDIFFSLPQRRQPQGKRRQSAVQAVEKVSAIDFFQNIASRRGYYPP